MMAKPSLSVLVVAHNEGEQLADCLSCLTGADELVVVLDKCTDESRDVASGFTHRLVEGSWELEGERRNIGLDSCGGEWILEIDADERVPVRLFDEIRDTIATAEPG